jgi:hypothetical protein
MEIYQVMELSRLVIHPCYQKNNFASWLLSRAVKLVKKEFNCVSRLVAFADLTYNHTGTIYRASNWKLISTSPPDYWYTDKDGFMMHKKTLYNRACKMSMKEREFAEKYNYNKVWGLGKRKFVYDI